MNKTKNNKTKSEKQKGLTDAELIEKYGKDKGPFVSVVKAMTKKTPEKQP